MTELTQYLNYQNWALQRLLENLEVLEDQDYFAECDLALKSIHKTLVHVAYYTQKPFQVKSDLMNESRKSLTDFLKEISQHLITLRPDEQHALQERLFEIVLHNIYHYGQIQTVLMLKGFEVKSLDIFMFLDEFNAK